MFRDPVKKMTDDELVECLQKVGTPLIMELMERGYRIRLDDRNSASGVPIFVRYRRPQAVSD
ncbi:hypothetical protein [Aureimonas leprariae]|uniref:hypothetical protein n=1 Tax=Plantimonas leprariae TaxID=2615207 RepID=UPI0013874700|nr:hypothetical protein [Aureimonas leprariae]